MLVFLSHSSTDTEAAIALKERLLRAPAANAAGMQIWLDVHELQPGDEWQVELEKALSKSEAFIVLVGSRGIVNWVNREVRYGIDRATGKGAIPFIPVLGSPDVDPETLPPFAQQFQATIDPLNDEDALARLIGSLLKTEKMKPAVLERPFVGLSAMSEAQADRFFGRDTEIQELTRILSQQRLVAVVADSGAGKSSIVQAGLIPAFRGGALVADDALSDAAPRHAIVMRPGADPVQGLKDAVHRAGRTIGITDIGKLQQLRALVDVTSPGETHYALACHIDHPAPDILLVIDQFEELLTATPPEKAAQFVELILGLLDDKAKPVRIVLTVRVDFFNLIRKHEALFERLVKDGDAAQFRLKRISDAGLEDVVKRPLEMAGHDNPQDRDALAAAIRRDITGRPGDVALVQMALYATWRKAQQTGSDLMSAYTQVGGVLGALAFQAEESRLTLSTEDQHRLLPLFARLVRLGDTGGATRRLASLTEMDPGRAQLAQALATEKAGRLLMVGEDTVEISHEALVSQWPWLQSQIQEHADDIRMLARLGDRTAAWRESGSSALPPEAERRAYLDLVKRHNDWLSPQEQACLKAANRRAGINKLAVGMVTVAFAASAGVSWYQARQLDDALQMTEMALKQAEGANVIALDLAEQATVAAKDARTQAQRAEANAAGALTAMASIAETSKDWENAIKLALAAWPRHKDGLAPQLADPIYTLSQVLPTYAQPEATPMRELARVVAKLSPDGQFFAVAEKDGNPQALYLARSDDASIIAELDPYPRGSAFAFSSDGRFFVASSKTNRLMFIDLQNLDAPRFHNLPRGPVTTVAFSADGKTLYAAVPDGLVYSFDTTGGLTSAGRTQLGERADIWAMSAHPNGTHLTVSKRNGPIEIWDLQSNALENTTFDYKAREIDALQHYADGNQLTIFANGRGYRVLLNAQTLVLDPSQLSFLRRPSDFSLHDAGFSHNSVESGHGLLFSLHAAGLIARRIGEDQKPIEWLYVSKGGLQAQNAGFSSSVIRLSPDGELLALGDGKGGITLFQAATGQARLYYSVPKGAVLDLQFTAADRLRVLSFDPDAPVTEIDLTTAPTIEWSTGRNSILNRDNLRWDSDLLALRDSDGILSFFSLEQGRSIAHIPQIDEDTVAAFSKDNSTLALLLPNGDAAIYDITGAPDIPAPIVLQGVVEQVRPLDRFELSPGGGTLVASGGSRAAGKVVAFDTRSQEQILSGSFQRGSEYVRFGFSGDEKRLFLQSTGTVNSYSLNGTNQMKTGLTDEEAGFGTDRDDIGVALTSNSPTLGWSSPDIAFSPDLARFSRVFDGEIEVYDTETAVMLSRLSDTSSDILAFRYASADRLHVVTANGRIGIWTMSDIPSGNAFAVACSLLPDFDVNVAVRGYPITISDPICGPDYDPPTPQWMIPVLQRIGLQR